MVTRWHKAPNRMSDPAYLALGPLAQAALRNLEELIATGGPIIGTRSRVLLVLGIEPKNGRHVLEPLLSAGFIDVQVDGDQMVVRLSSEVEQIVARPPAEVVQRSSRHTSEVVQTPGRPPADGEQTPGRWNNLSANDAGFSDRSLIENKNKNKSKNKNPPIPPKGFSEWYARYPNKKGRANAIAAWVKLQPDDELQALMLAGLEKAVASPQWQEHIKAKTLHFIPHPATWLNGRRWEDEYEPALPATSQPSDVDPEVEKWHDPEYLAKFRADQRARRQLIPEPEGQVAVDEGRGDRTVPLLSGGDWW